MYIERYSNFIIDEYPTQQMALIKIQSTPTIDHLKISKKVHPSSNRQPLTQNHHQPQTRLKTPKIRPYAKQMRARIQNP